jgi:hypothetical protein
MTCNRAKIFICGNKQEREKRKEILLKAYINLFCVICFATGRGRGEGPMGGRGLGLSTVRCGEGAGGGGGGGLDGGPVC